MKRLIDVVVSGLGLVATSPLFGIVAILIKIDSRGPIIFRQTRVGLNGVLFQIHKFRTMRVEQQPGSSITVAGDLRITRVGTFLRRTKLDELPQLYDVLLGRMSLVGPRPEVPEYVEAWPADLRSKVLSVRPGITDPAAIEFRNENELLAAQPDPETFYREVITPRKLDLYEEYIDRRTLAGDLRLVARTVGLMFAPDAPERRADR